MAFAFSPSNLSQYRDCPLRFYGSSISKELKWKASEQKSRGQVVHSQIEKMLRNGWNDSVTLDEKVDRDYVHHFVDNVREMVRSGYTLKTEHDMCITRKGESVDFFHKDAFLRARADVIMIPDDPRRALHVFDIKTGRIYDNDALQLRIEALLGHIIYKVPAIFWTYWYVDQGEDRSGTIDLSMGLYEVQDIYDLMREAGLAIKNKNFPATPNKFCRWCDWHNTEMCKP